ncbi:MAG: hypothetical protein MJE77_37840 [Proteobacteria bacterium]|nr:hypothetical protein [Pseudomonadota bacterium]
MREWVRVCWHLKGGIPWTQYLALPRRDRITLLEELNQLIEKHNEAFEN